MQDITALAFDPANTNVLYAGTPHLPWKTTDGGATWHSISSGLIDDSDIFSIRVDPNHPQLVFASACSGIYRSDSGGRGMDQDPRHSRHPSPHAHHRGRPAQFRHDFRRHDAGAFQIAGRRQDLAAFKLGTGELDGVRSGDPRTLYLATEFAGILKSTDSGETFRPMNEGFANHRLSEITSDGKRLYASSTYEGLYGGVFVSSDGGLQWSLRANEEALQGRNLHSLTASPAEAEEVFAASDDAILKSADGGKTWVPVTEPRSLVARTSRQRPDDPQFRTSTHPRPSGRAAG